MESFEIESAAAVDENWIVTSGKIWMIENNTKTNTEEEEMDLQEPWSELNLTPFR